MSKIIFFTPVDIEVELPSQQDLISYCKSRSVEHPYDVSRGLVIPVACRDDLSPWNFVMDFHSIRFSDKLESDIENNQFRDSLKGIDLNATFENLHWEPRFKNLFPELIDAVRQQPWKLFNAVFLTLVGDKPSLLHKDPDTDWGGADSGWSTITPERYNIMLTCHETPVMIWSNETETYNPAIDKRYPCYAFNNADFLHGSTVPDERTIGKRIQLVVHGVLDDTKHIELLTRSIKKFKDRVGYMTSPDHLRLSGYKNILEIK